MKALRFTVPGEPCAKGRPKVTMHGTYTPKKTVQAETLVKEMFAVAYPQHKPIEGPIRMIITAYFKIPKSASKKQRTLMLSGEIRPTKRPDLDNIYKLVADALNGIAYVDDSQIVFATVKKYYSDTPRTEVVICEICS